MTVPTLSVSSSAPSALDADVLVVGVLKGAEGATTTSTDAAVVDLLGGLDLASLGVTGAADEHVRLPGTGVAATVVATVGLGGAADAHAVRHAAGSAARQLTGVDRIVLDLPTADEATAEAALEGAALGAYAFDAFRGSSASESRRHATDVVLATGTTVPESVVHRATTVATAVHTVRDLSNTPPQQLAPADLADRAVSLAEGLDLDVEVLAEEELRAGGYGGILGVGQGSSRAPRLVKVVWAPEGATRHLALVGKGITYDTGGLSLKPSASMLGMKDDMTGAATVLAAVVAAAELRLPVKVTAWLCVAENMPSGTAIRPDDVLTIRGGTTVEVTNTDAEGRLVMADGLVAASEEQPDAIVDVATLTGAQVVALGTRTSGVMGNDAFADRVTAAADAVGEVMWRMPLPEELRPRLASDVADLVNATPGNTAAGMLLAGVFLQEFVGTREGTEERISWAHVDIAGPSNNKGGGWGPTPKGSTGVAVRTLLALAAELGAE